MSNKEKLPKLVDVYRPPKSQEKKHLPLEKRQLPLVVDENLTVGSALFLIEQTMKKHCFVHSFLQC